jgi:hypothetical protein
MAVRKIEDIIAKLEERLKIAIDELDARGIHVQTIHISSEREYNLYEAVSLPPGKDRYKRKITINLTTDVPGYLKGG